MIHTTPVELLTCALCDEEGFGPVGSSICMTCISNASRCHSCSSEVVVTLYPDASMTLDVVHDAGCPRRAA